MTHDRLPLRKGVRAAIGLLVALVFLLAVSIMGSAAALPGCDSCHTDSEFVSATDASPHAEVSCASCHVSEDAVSRLEYGAHVVSGAIRGVFDYDERAAASVDNTSCLSCHEETFDTVVEAKGIRIDHEQCAADSRCSDCHSSTAHGNQVSWERGYNMDACLTCHGQQGELVKCDTCHVARQIGDRLSSGPWQVTHGANWQETHGMGDAFTCAACHPRGYCDRCHGVGLPHEANLIEQHPALASDPAAKCTSCHDQSTFCDDCHGLEMPHPIDFKPTHADLVHDDGDNLCRTCHSAADCTGCHVKHIHPGGAIGTTGGR